MCRNLALQMCESSIRRLAGVVTAQDSDNVTPPPVRTQCGA